ncbi:MAG: relaxase/mobilization nuclease domain-containing protein [Candidatus Aphodocola sp.]
MAVTKIWKIKSNLKKVINYISDSEKTVNEDYDKDVFKDLHNLIDYTTNDIKTEKKCYVSTINCDEENPLEDMINTKKRFNKNDGILAYHAYQSFKENEVSPELAHEIGIKLAEEMWGDKFEVVVSTHLNTNHIHNHFVINSVSFIDGKKYYDSKSKYAELRNLSDSICEEYGLSTVKEQKKYNNFYKSNIKKSNYHTIVKDDLDRAIKLAYTYSDFERILKNWNYDVMYRAGKLTLKKYPYKKNIRVVRAYGEEYDYDRLNERIKEEHFERKIVNNNHNNKIKFKHSSLYRLYIHCCYLLKVVPKKYPNRYISPEVRAEARKMDMLSNEMRLLVRNKIETYEQFFLYKTNVCNLLDGLIDKRNKLWYKHNKTESNIDKKLIKIEIDKISREINEVRKEVVLCKDIEERSSILRDKLEQYEKELQKEERKDMVK